MRAPTRRLVSIASILLALVVALIARSDLIPTWIAAAHPTTSPAAASSRPLAAGTRVHARTLLTHLATAADHPDGYDRAAWPHWEPSPTRPGCDTRDLVLIAESTTPVTVSPHCYLTGGSWTSPYDDITTTDPTTFDIDHVVPLAEAHRSGGWAWDTARRTAYANDTGYRGSLAAVTATSNRTKSDQDPTTWLPARHRCRYLVTWLAIKYRWQLTVDPDEAQTLSRLTRTCHNPLVTVPEKAPTP